MACFTRVTTPKEVDKKCNRKLPAPCPPKTPDALSDQCLLVRPNLLLRRGRMASLGSCLTDRRETRSKDYGKRDPQVRSTLGMQSKEWSSGEEHSVIRELSRLRAGRQSRDSQA
ncbi:hypothetical protein Tco_0234329, partial [Tanacetum coccineum]